MKVDELARRPSAYLNDSGVNGLTSGSAFVLMGISQLIWPMLARSYPNWALVVQSSGTAATLLILWVGLKLKRRVVFPRAGYAAPRYSPSVRIITALGFLASFLIWMLARSGHRM